VRQTFEIPLDIPDVTIEKVTTNRLGHIEITVKSTVAGVPCHQCGKMTTKFYGEDREITLRHLPILGRRTYIRLRPKRSACPYCQGHPTTTQTLSWYTPRSIFTRAYEEQLWLLLVNSTIQDVCLQEDVGYEAIMGVIDRYMEREINWEELTQIDVLGLDEIALKQGHRDFVAIITGRIETETVILGVLPDRKKATVKACLRGIPKHLRHTIHAVCSDMYEGFVNAAKEVFGKRVKIVIDRLHVAKLYRSGLDKLRKRELKRLQQELAEEEYGQLQGAMWALRKSKEHVTDEDNDVLVRLFGYSSGLKMAYEFCGELTAIFDTPMSQKEGKQQLQAWMQKVRASQLRCFDSFLTT
jgi:transposase